MMVTKLTNVDFILLYLHGQGGSARRLDIKRATEDWRFSQGNEYPLCGMYFARYKDQSPFYTFDKENSVLGPTRRYFSDSNCAKVSMWKLTPAGVCRAYALKRQIIRDCANAVV